MLEEANSGQWAKVPSRTRDSLAAFYTPKAVSDALAKWAVRDKSESVLEPGFGGCEMLDSVFQRFASLAAPSPWAGIFGCDISEYAHKLLAKRLAPAMPKNFVAADFLRTEPGIQFPKVNAVVSNPPYIGHHDFAVARRASIAKASRRYLVPLPGQANLWAHFLVHSLGFLKPGGRLAFVLPLSYRHADFAAGIREYLAKNFATVTIVECVERLFRHASTLERVVLVLADGMGEPSRRLRETRCASIEDLERILDGDGDPSVADEQRREEANALLARLYSAPHVRRLGSLASIRIGVVTGATDFFLGSDATWEARNIPARFLVPITGSSRDLSGLLISRSELLRHARKGRPTLGLVAQSDQDERIATYLRTRAAQRAKKTATAKKRSPWFSLALGQHPDCIIPSLSHRGPRIVLLQNGVWATNTFYVIHFHQRARVHRKLAAISMLSSFSQLYGELAGQPMSQGGLKFTLEAIKQYPLMLPEGVNETDIGRVLVEVDQFLRKGADGAAREAADRIILAGISSDERALLGDFKDRHWSRRQSDGSKTVGPSQAASPENLVPA